MASNRPEQDAFKANDRVDEKQEQEQMQATDNLLRDAYAANQSDRAGQKFEKVEASDRTGDMTTEERFTALAASLNGILERVKSLQQHAPDALAETVKADGGTTSPLLMAIVKNPGDYQLAKDAKPQDVINFLRNIEMA